MRTTRRSGGFLMSWMRGLIGLGLLGVIALGVVISMGRDVPVEHRAFASGRVEVPQDVVWTLMNEPATWPAWRTTLYKTSMEPGGGVCWKESYRSGDVMVCTVEEVPKVRKVLRIAEKMGHFSGTWTYTLEPLGEHATKVTVTEDDLVHSTLQRFIGHYLIGEQTHAKQFVADLQAEAVHQR
jgi:hypothetical protein